jgi:hypothetical protein
MSMSRLRQVAAAASALLLLGGCGNGGVPAAAPGAWSQTADSPLPADLSNPISFWTGKQLVVAGGSRSAPVAGVAEQFELTFSGTTVAYDPAEDAWRELEPLSVPGYDGISIGSGVWTGNSWLGFGWPCQNGIASARETDLCAPGQVGLQWTASDGWKILQETPAELRKEEQQIPLAVGRTESGVVFTTVLGYLILDVTADQQWTYTPWPPFAEGSLTGGGCMVDGSLWTRGNDDPQGDNGGTATPSHFVAAIDLATGAGRTLLRTEPSVDQLGLGLLCRADGVLFQVNGEISQLRSDGSVTPVDAPTITEDVGPPVGVTELPLRVASDHAYTERAVFRFGDEAWLYEVESSRFSLLQPTIELIDLTSGPDVIFGRVPSYYESPAAGEWFMLNASASIEELTRATFPVAADTPVKGVPR